ncbi:TIR domain-containing protein [Parafrankia irregularis]|uniref:TIR domain-containing protein n=1 Tax=Parafrankia irregularis TaxID=795642 RepID=A0A0S4QUQ1_9ACTN|nr:MULTISPECIES: toll/interleukin-1 receptor domain-containing protein [Parafrankia]MBE3205888.1 toll/interleukin-1 receptor domain-containing protein [Parafrankia sp. CH37]CUU58166.1 TIR domain-containing protein [Parafrankia irregularis]
MTTNLPGTPDFPQTAPPPLAPPAGWPADDLPLSREDLQRFRTALAAVAPDRTSAEMLLGEIDVPRTRLPSFHSTPEHAWFEVFQTLEAGVVAQPCRRLLAAVLVRYPANRVFLDLHDRHVAGRRADATGSRPVPAGASTPLPAPTPSPPTVFLSHDRADQGKVQALANLLTDAGLTPWLGSEQVTGGSRRDLAVRRAVLDCDFFVPCLSATALARPSQLHREIRIALDHADELPDHEVFIVPARLDECDPPSALQEYRWVDLFTADGFRQLTRALRAPTPSARNRRSGPSGR